jgi:hypothetical protein
MGHSSAFLSGLAWEIDFTVHVFRSWRQLNTARAPHLSSMDHFSEFSGAMGASKMTKRAGFQDGAPRSCHARATHHFPCPRVVGGTPICCRIAELCSKHMPLPPPLENVVSRHTSFRGVAPIGFAKLMGSPPRLKVSLVGVAPLGVAKPMG